MNLELRPLRPQVLVGDTVEVGIYAVASGVDESFTGVEVILSWDKAYLELQEAIPGEPHPWFMFGLLPDSLLDGLNDTFDDGNARFEAVSFSDATARADGLLITTLRFSALSGTALTEVVVEPEFGQYSRTQVLVPGEPGVGVIDVTGTLGTTSVTIGAASLQAIDMTMPAGRSAEALVRGSVTGLSAYGVMIVLELVPREGVSGTVTYTLTPPPDVAQRGDPWPGAGTFSPFDTNALGFSDLLNGSVDDNGVFLATAVSYSGPLSAFPLQSSPDAVGVWDLMLTTSDGQDSFWEEARDTTLVHGTLRIVDRGDGDGDTGIDLRDFSEFQVCYTGEVVSSAQPAYSLVPERRCVVYDFDGDGDVDELDLREFSDAVSGPVQ